MDRYEVLWKNLKDLFLDLDAYWSGFDLDELSVSEFARRKDIREFIDYMNVQEALIMDGVGIK